MMLDRICAAPAATFALLGMVAGCTNVGTMGFRHSGKLTWYGFLNGDDLRMSCGADSPDRYRLILTDDRARRVHIYEVLGDPAAGIATPPAGAMINARAIALSDLAEVDLGDPVEPAVGAHEDARARLDGDQFGRLKDRLAENGVFETAPDGQRLPSDGFVWLISGCHDGRFFFSVYNRPTPEYRDAIQGVPRRVQTIP